MDLRVKRTTRTESRIALSQYESIPKLEQTPLPLSQLSIWSSEDRLSRELWFVFLKLTSLISSFPGQEWGTILVSLSSSIDSQPLSPSAEINGFWSSNVSIRMEKEILLKSLQPCSDPRSVDCPSDIWVSIHFCPKSGRKFKVLSVACC
jgi:hypothetical protein